MYCPRGPNIQSPESLNAEERVRRAPVKGMKHEKDYNNRFLFEDGKMGPWAKGHGQPLKSEKDMKMDSFPGTPERNTGLPIS